MYNFLTLDQASLSNKRVLLRVDFNVPILKGQITDTTRIERVIPTINYLLQKNATVIIISHLGRPTGPDQKLSLKPIAEVLSKLMDTEVVFIPDINSKPDMAAKLYMLENLRFYPGEEANSDDFAQQLSQFGDIYVNDGFAISHRAHASVVAITKYLPSYAGLLMQEELQALSASLTNPQKPVAAIVGGSKVSTKLGVLKNLVKKVDYLIPAGGIVNTFLLERGDDIGPSLAEPDLLKDVALIKQTAKDHNCEIILPIDSAKNDGKIFDIGPQTIEHYKKILSACKTLVWNGPLGVFEIPPFDQGTAQIGEFVAQQCAAGKLYAVVGGGETIAALNQKGLLDKISYASTAGGAFLEWLEGVELPGVKALYYTIGN